MTAPINVDVGICTFRRTMIVAAMESVSKQVLPPHVTLRVIVADNDDHPDLKPVILDAAHRLDLNCTYVFAPARNISIARNACLEAATARWLALIDDDEIAEPGWLRELLDAGSSSGADVILGPVRAAYEDETPDWMRRGDFHSTRPVVRGGHIATGYTCNVLLDLQSSAIRGRRFDLSFGNSGGEDTEFFCAVTKAGGTIAYAPRAVVTEAVASSRASLRWLMIRRFRSGQTHGRISRASRSLAGLASALLVTAAKAAACVVGTAIRLFDPVGWRRWALRAALHFGALAGLIRGGGIRLYGGPPA